MTESGSAPVGISTPGYAIDPGYVPGRLVANLLCITSSPHSPALLQVATSQTLCV